MQSSCRADTTVLQGLGAQKGPADREGSSRESGASALSGLLL